MTGENGGSVSRVGVKTGVSGEGHIGGLGSTWDGGSPGVGPDVLRGL